MAVHISSEFKRKLTAAKRKNRKPPVWVYLKTRDRSLLRSRKRNWRFEKLKLRTQHGKKARRALVSTLKSRARLKAKKGKAS